MTEHTLTLLHISDLHERESERSPWRRRRVLGDAWLANLDRLREDGPYDLVCFTGDVAFAGQPREYERTTEFFQEVLDRLGLGWDRFFPIPGNHDIDRRIAKPQWKRLRENLSRASRPEVSSWLAGGRAPLGFTDRQRDQVLQRQSAYRQWVRDLGRSDLDPTNSPHGLLGYRKTLPGFPFPVHVLGLDSSWMCGDDNDSGKLWLTDEQVMRLATDVGSEALDGFRLALVHHPLDDLADGADARRLLTGRVDLVLRGHLHEPEAQTWVDPDRTLRQIAAGCLYEHDRYPNACERLRITLDERGRPLRYEARFRGWSPKGGFWFDDNSLYSGTVDGRLTFWVEARPAEPPANPRVGKIFVGREPELAQLEESLLPEGVSRPVAICSVQGMAGVGKSYLAERFALLHGHRFPGGVWRLALEVKEESVTAEALLGQLGDRLRLSPEPSGLAERVRDRLLLPRSLLHIENVDTKPLVEPAAGLILQLKDCSIVVSGRYQALGQDVWVQIPIRPFDEATALAQLAEELGEEGRREEPSAYQRLVRTLGFLPLAIHLAAGYLKAGHTVEGFLARLRATGFALPTADVAEPILTRDESRLVIVSTFALSLDALKDELGADGEPLLSALSGLGHAPAAGFGLSLGAAIADLSSLDFERLAVAAQRLSLLDALPPAERRDRAYRLHPLLAELLRARSGETGGERVHARMTEWFCSRLPRLPAGQEEEQGRRWREIQADTGALIPWLSQAHGAEGPRVERAGSWFAMTVGPFHAWLSFCEGLLSGPLEDVDRSSVLWTLGQVALRTGDLDRALRVAQDQAKLDRTRGEERDAALAVGLIADVLEARGELDEALRIRREEEIPVYERIGDIQERARAMGQIAGILQIRGELDEALRIHREEEIPVYERIGDVRSRAVTMGKIADVLEDRGDLDEAMRIRREEQLPVYEQLGDVRGRTVTMGKIADVLQARGDLDEALGIYRKLLPVFEQLGDVQMRAIALGKIAYALQARGDLEEALRIRREEQLPVFEKLGDSRNLLVGRTNLALVHLKRNQNGDRDTAIALLRLALEAAERMRLPETERIRSILQQALGSNLPEGIQEI